MIDPLFFIISFVHVVTAFLTIIYIPGEAFNRLVFINHTFSNTEKQLLSIASGIVISSLIGSLFLWVFEKIYFVWLYSVLLLLVIICFVSLLLRNQKTNEDNNNNQFKFPYTQLIFWGLVYVSGFLFFQIPGLGQYSFNKIVDEPYQTTEFYISPSYLEEHDSTPIRNNDFYQIPVEIVNNDFSEKTYLIGVSQKYKIIGDIVNISVSPNEQAIIILNIPYYQISPNLPIDINLYNLYSNQKPNRLRVWLDLNQ